MHPRSRGVLARLALAGLAAVAALLALCAPASAATPTTGWTCRAQSLTVTAGGLTPLQPLTNVLASGGDFQPCAPTGTSPVGQALAPLSSALRALGITVDAVETSTTSDVAVPTRDQVPTSRAKVTTLDIGFGGTAIVHADALESTTTGRCVSGRAQLSSTSSVGGLTLFGQAVDLNQPVTQVSRGIAGLQVLVRVTPGAVTETAADGMSRRALRVEVLNVVGPAQITLLDLNAAFSNVSVKGDPCAPAAAPTVGVPTATDRTLSAAVTAPAGDTIAGCAFTVTPAGGGTPSTVPGVVGGGRCTAVLPPSRFPAGSYTATATATTSAGGGATGAASAPFTLAAPTGTAPAVTAPTLSGRTVSATVTPASGTTVSSCRFAVTPAGGSTVAVDGAVADGRCTAALPRASFPPGQYVLAATATGSDGQVGEASGTGSIAGPTVGTPISVGQLVGAPVTPGAGATVTSCEIDVTPAAGGAIRTVPGTYDAPTGGCAAVLPTATFPDGAYDVVVRVLDSNGDRASSGARLTVSTFAFGTPATGSTPPSTSDVAQALLKCLGGRVALTDVSRTGSRVRITGVAQPALKGTSATIRFSATGRSAQRVGRARIADDGTFAVTVRAPASRLRTARANGRYTASVPGSTSGAFKLVRRTVLTRSGVSRGTIRLSGRVASPLPRRRSVVRIVRATSCSKARTVTTVRTDARGRFSASFKAPADGSAGVYRASVKVPSRPGGVARSTSFTLYRIIAGR